MLTTWTSMAAMQVTFLLLLGGLSCAKSRTALRPETSRKLLHTGAGLLTLTLPFAFHDVWPVAVLIASSAVVLAAIRLVPSLGARFGAAAYRVDRTSYGDFYFLTSALVLFWLTRGQSPLLFVIPMLVLTLADATGALVGARYGLTPYSRAHKTLEGSAAFATVAFACVHVPLLLWTSVGRAESLLIAATLALLVMLLEAGAWRGRDNLLIPIGGYMLLSGSLNLALTTLVVQFALALVLVVLCVLWTLRSHSFARGHAWR